MLHRSIFCFCFGLFYFGGGGGDVGVFFTSQIFCSLLGSTFKSQSSLLDPYSFLSERRESFIIKPPVHNNMSEQ